MRIACIWAPDFPIWAARQRSPELSGRQLVIGGAPSDFRKPATACSAEAAAAGAAVGMTLRQVQARCPDAVIVPPDPQGDAQAFELVLAVLDQFSPVVATTEPGKAYCDVMNLERLFGPERALAEAVQAAIREAVGIDVVVGIAGNRFCAEMAAISAACAPSSGGETKETRLDAASPAQPHTSDAGRGVLIVPPEHERSFLAPLPLRHVPDVPNGMLERMQLLGIQTMGQFARVSRLGLIARYGKEAGRAHELACGSDRTPLQPRAPSLQFSERVQFDLAEVQQDRLIFALRRLLTRVEARLRRESLLCRAFEVLLEHERSEPSRLHLNPIQPTASATRLTDLARWQIEKRRLHGRGSSARDGIDAMTVLVTETVVQSNLQPGLFSNGLVQGERLTIALDRLRGRLGQETVQHALTPPSESVSSRRPEEAFQFVPYRSPTRTNVSDLTQPLPLSFSIALRFIDPPRAIQTYIYDGKLRSLYVSRHREPVLASAGPWRLDEAWWTAERHVERDYYQVLTRSQTVYLIYQDHLADRWYMQGCFD